MKKWSAMAEAAIEWLKAIALEQRRTNEMLVAQLEVQNDTNRLLRRLYVKKEQS